MRACRVLPGAAGCGRLLVAGPRPQLLPGGPGPSWATARRAAGRWPSPGLRVPQAAEAEQQVLRAGGPCGRFIARPQLARTVQRCLQAGSGPQPVVLECAPGKPTASPARAAAGARRVPVTLRSRCGPRNGCGAAPLPAWFPCVLVWRAAAEAGLLVRCECGVWVVRSFGGSVSVCLGLESLPLNTSL